MSSKSRIRFPSDTFVKRQFTYLDEIAHKYYNLAENIWEVKPMNIQT